MSNTPNPHGSASPLEPQAEAAAPRAGAAESPFAEVGAAAVIGEAFERQSGDESVAPRSRVGARYIWFLVLAFLGGSIALIAPLGISLALRVQELVPQNVEVLGYVVGVGTGISAITGPLVGMWSDRTRTRFGRRRPFSLVGALVGIAGLATMAAAPDVWVLALGWAITQIGWGTANGSLLFSQADRLPEEQRGRVAGLTGLMNMIGSVVGVGIASAFIGSNFLVFLVPGFIGLLFVLLWVTLVKEKDSRSLPAAQKMTAGSTLRAMVFNPRDHTDFAWNWLARLLFNFGVTFATTFTTLFFASRLGGGQVADVGPLIVILSLIGVAATAGGALLGGLLSDKLRRRRLFVLLSGISFTIGAITMAAGGSNAGILIAGAVLTNLGLGVFSAVDQAIVLDVLPSSESQAGRFLGINAYSTAIAQAVAPVIAAPLLLIGVSGAEKNYGLLFLIAAAFTLVGGVIVTLKVRGTR